MTKEQEARPVPFRFEEVAERAREAALAHGGHLPTLLVEDARGCILGQILDLPPTHEGRWHLMYAVGIALAHSGAATTLKQVFFIVEGWMSMVSADGTITQPPSQDPNRIEVLVIDHLDLAQQQPNLAVFEMLRDGQGQLVALAPVTVPGDGEPQVSSPLLNAFVEGFQTGMQGGPTDA